MNTTTSEGRPAKTDARRVAQGRRMTAQTGGRVTPGSVRVPVKPGAAKRGNPSG